MIQKMARIFGIVMLVVGVLGFVPGIVSGGMLLGIFEVDMIHNIVHILTGIVALAASMMGGGVHARLFFKVFGVVYALVAVLGLVMGGSVLGMMMNMADHLLHIVIAAFALYVGFAMKESPMMSMSSAPAPSSMPSSGSTSSTM